jgi:hypothetical protein
MKKFHDYLRKHRWLAWVCLPILACEAWWTGVSAGVKEAMESFFKGMEP